VKESIKAIGDHLNNLSITLTNQLNEFKSTMSEETSPPPQNIVRENLEENLQLPSVSKPVSPQPPTSPNSNPKNKGWHPFFKGILWGMAFSFTATFSGAVGALLVLFSPISPLAHLNEGEDSLLKNPLTIFNHEGWKSVLQYRISRPVNILVMGIDRIPPEDAIMADVFAGRSDTILLVRFDPRDYSLKMLSIPRDTRIEDSRISLPKINQANLEGGPKLTATLLSENLNDVQIDRYVRVTTEAFVELVDLVGGIDVYVPQRMKYQDQTQKLNIDLEEGWQTLSGDQSEQFARFRGDRNGDIGRVQRQQILIKALGDKLKHPMIIPRIPQIIELLQKYVDTNLSLEEMLALASFGQNVESDKIKMVLLPGRFSQTEEYDLSYWIMSRQQKNVIMEEFFDQDPQVNPWNTANDTRNKKRVRIAIQNASNETGLARQVANYLIEKDYTNIYLIEDYSRILDETEIVVQKGDFESARNLKDILGIGYLEGTSTGSLDSDITIRVGKDWFNNISLNSNNN
jgi:polyisoprenyl-teichoic acid--peptidoglycan teichoic acid transferase